MTAEDLNRPKFRRCHKKLTVVQRWCDDNGVSRDRIRAVRLSGVYGYGAGDNSYVVDWD